MVVWRHANEFRFASQVSGWIFGIAYRTALKSLYRERYHSATRSLGECPEQTVDPALETEVQDWVMHGLNRLSDEQAVTHEQGAAVTPLRTLKRHTGLGFKGMTRSSLRRGKLHGAAIQPAS